MFIRRQLITATLFYLLLTILFNFSLVCNVLFTCTQSHPSDGIITEFISEISLQNLLHLENPYAFHQKLFYPFYTSYALADPGSAHLPLYALIRAVLPSHQTLLLIVSLNLFLNYFIMYLLLRKMKISFWIALLGGFIYGAMPFVSYRVLNHYTYTPLFLFPLLFLILYFFIEHRSRHFKIFYGVISAITGVYILLTNFYFFISVVIAIASIICYSLLFHPKTLWQIVRGNIWYLIPGGVIFILFLIPWLQSVVMLGNLYTNLQMQGFGGAWLLSSDLLNVFLPSQHNPFYQYLFFSLSTVHGVFQKLHTMYISAYAKNAYAGILLLLTLAGTLSCWKKIPTSIRAEVRLYSAVSLFFLSLSFGPFLQIFNRWFVSVEGVMVVLPMPFLLLHYMPGMDTLRAPSRFVPLYIFFLVLAASYVWDYLYNKISQTKMKYSILTVAFLVVFLDQMYFIPSPASEYTTHIPTKLYQRIAKDQEQSTVLEIPFTVRDGFSYRGNVKAVTPMRGTLMHGKSVMGGYIARVPNEIFSYYDALPFISYIAGLIDEGNNTDGTTTAAVTKPFVGNSTDTNMELDFLSIKYIILKQDKPYSKNLAAMLSTLGFKQIDTDEEFSLYSKPRSKNEYLAIDFKKAAIHPYYIGSPDINPKKKGYQFDTFAKVFIHNKIKKQNLIFQTSATTKSILDIYKNGVFIESIALQKSVKSYLVPLDTLTPGVQMFDFVLNDSPAGSHVTLYTVEVK